EPLLGPVIRRVAGVAATAGAEGAEEAEKRAGKNSLLHEGDLQLGVQSSVDDSARPVLLPRERRDALGGTCPAVGGAVALTALCSGRPARSEPSRTGIPSPDLMRSREGARIAVSLWLSVPPALTPDLILSGLRAASVPPGATLLGDVQRLRRPLRGA